MTILILGGTGFLGRNLVKYISINYPEKKIIVFGHSENKSMLFKKLFKNIEIYLLNADNPDDIKKIERIVIKYNIESIINCIAMKHVFLCQSNIINSVYTNIIFNQNLLDLCSKYKINNVIGISTDKANNPVNVYGMTKYMMERIYIDMNYRLYQGVNFLWSDGSVLDIWYNQYIFNKPLTYSKLNTTRYYNIIEDTCKYIYDELDTDKQIIFPKKVLKISLNNLLEAFKILFNYNNTEYIEMLDYEKDNEELSNNNIEIIELSNINEIVELLGKIYKYIYNK